MSEPTSATSASDRPAPGSPTQDPATPDQATPDHATPDSAVTAARRLAFNEDWAATVVGLLLLALVLTGLLPGWLVP